MSDQVRLVNQQLAFSQSHLQAARISDGFMRRCQLQACKLQMYLLIHAYVAEIADRINLKWQLNLGALKDSLAAFEQQLQQQDKISSDFNHLAELISTQAPWKHWADLSTSALFIGKNELKSPALSQENFSQVNPVSHSVPAVLIASSQAPIENPLNSTPEEQIELLTALLETLQTFIQIQRQNKIEF